jgi:hypothetical protein
MLHFTQRRPLAFVLSAAILLMASQPVWASDDQTAPAAGDLDVAAGSAIAPFPDVPANHWAFEALTQLAKDGYLKGYPGGKFLGQRPMTRYEVAFLVNQAVSALKDRIASGQTADESDILALRKLVAVLGPEIADLQARVKKLEATTNDLQQTTTTLQRQEAAVQTEADATATQVRSAKTGLRFFSRPGTIDSNVGIVNGPAAILPVAGAHGFIGPGAPFPAGYASTAAAQLAGQQGQNFGTPFTWGNAGTTNSTPVGKAAHGTNITYGSLFLVGNVTPTWNYGARLSASIRTEAGNGTSTTAPAFCTSATGAAVTGAGCSYTDLSGTSSSIGLNLDYLFIGWNSPGGFYGQVGRVSLAAGPWNLSPLMYGGTSVTGVTFGIHDPNHVYDGWFAYGLPPVSSYTLATANAGTATGNVCTPNVVGLNTGTFQTPPGTLNGYCNTTHQRFASSASYLVKSTKTAIGYEYDYHTADPLTYWDAAAVNCGPTAGVIAINNVACANNHLAVGPAQSGSFITAQGNDGTIAPYISQYFGRGGPQGQWNLLLQYGRHLGNDPFTGAPWVGGNSYLGTLTFASKGNVMASSPVALIPQYGTANSNVVQALFMYSGAGTGNDSWGTAGSTVPPNNLSITATSGTILEGLQIDHWFANNVRAGITGLHVQNIPGVTLPAGNLSTCPGCFVNSININQIYLDTWFYQL